MAKLKGNSSDERIIELRFHPLIGEWIAVAAYRERRPWRPEHCPFCPGNPETGFNWRTLALPNRYPVLAENAPKPSHHPLVKSLRARGFAEVLVESPDHHAEDFCDLSLEQVVEALKLYREETRRLSRYRFVRYVYIFRNKGAEAGVSLVHPHSQLYALPVIPPRVAREIQRLRIYRARRGSCFLCDMVREELKLKVRIVCENEGFITLVPFYAMWPRELHIYPKEHASSLLDLSDNELQDLAESLRMATVALNAVVESSMPYIMAVHQAPVKGDYSDYHFHIEFYPLWRGRALKKYAAGAEIGGGIFTYDGLPEEHAEELREALQRISIHSL